METVGIESWNGEIVIGNGFMVIEIEAVDTQVGVIDT